MASLKRLSRAIPVKAPIYYSQCPRTTRYGIQRRMLASHAYQSHSTAISTIPTSIDVSSQEFNENTRQMREVLLQMERLHQTIMAGGSAKAREKHLNRGKMLPRE